MDSLYYPTFEIVEGRGIIPRINLPENYQDLVRRFYECGRRTKVDDYAKGLEELLRNSGSFLDIRLNWHEVEGLINISVGSQGGLDLNTSGTPQFQEHNLGWHNSFIAGSVAMKYILELLKSRT